MKLCILCQELTVDPEQEARYDVLNPSYDPNVSDMSAVGPYCPDCWTSTETYQRLLLDQGE